MNPGSDRQLAEHKAVVKNLTDVETLGATSAINSDKTGTLTMNEMTVESLYYRGEWFTVAGSGYEKTGEVRHVAGQPVPQFNQLALGLTLCSDATVSDEGAVIGDPTEAALVVLAAKLGADAELTRGKFPRVAEVPFDSAYKFMGTFHRMENEQGKPVVRCFVKGAPDVLIALGSSYWLPDCQILPITEDNRNLALEENDRMAQGGERVMVVARRDFDPDAQGWGCGRAGAPTSPSTRAIRQDGWSSCGPTAAPRS